MSQSLGTLTLFPGDAALPQSGPLTPRHQNKLWLAIHFPKLALEALNARDAGRVVVVTELRNGKAHVIAVNDSAIDAGIRPGSKLSAAYGFSDSLVALERRIDIEQSKLEELAVIAGRFTPVVSLESPDTVLLEVGGSLKLFKGVEAIKNRLAVLLRSHCVTFHMCVAPTALAALWMARCGEEDVLSGQRLAGRLNKLPLSATEWPHKIQALLKSMGIRTLGDCLRLPRDGFARRIGYRYLQALDRARGDHDLRLMFEPGLELVTHIELDDETDNIPLLVSIARRLITRLLEELHLRQLRVSGFDCIFHHTAHVDTVEAIRFSEPTGEEQRFVRLLEDRFERLRLVAPAMALTLRTDSIEPGMPGRDSLFDTSSDGDAKSAECGLIERIRARFGTENLYSVDCVDEHRPEAAWARSTPLWQRQRRPPLAVERMPRRPLWLLPIPRRLRVTPDKLPCYGSRAPLCIERDPERIENGWWDGKEVRRDYYIASNVHGERLWIFRDQSSNGGWYLHGFFG